MTIQILPQVGDRRGSNLGSIRYGSITNYASVPAKSAVKRGYMLIRKIRAMLPEMGGTIPAIALTAYAAEADSQQAIAAGFGQHITKPVEPAKLLRAIANSCQDAQKYPNGEVFFKKAQITPCLCWGCIRLRIRTHGCNEILLGSREMR